MSRYLIGVRVSGIAQTAEPNLMYNRSVERQPIYLKPVIAAMHGPHSLVRLGDKVRFGPIR